MSSKVFRLRSEPNNYPWGKVGKDSLAAQLAPNSVGKDFELDPKKEYAELWMGTHPNNPSSLFDSPSTPLTKHLSENESLLGEAKKFPARYPGSRDKEFGGQGHVPYLFKILTCKQALPLQIHPDIELAKKLHEQDPEQFLDTNHKPEIAVCLSESFLGFASFRPIDQARALLNATPEIQQMPAKVRDAVKALDTGASKEDMRNVFEILISVQGEEAKSSINTFIERLKKDGVEVFAKVDKLSSDEKERLVRAAKILDEYNHGDASIYASLFLMNLVELKKGEGMYVGADAPHAWLSGEIVELMAASDNVLNVGFIPSEDKNSTSLVAKAITATPKPIPEIMLDSHKFVKSSTGNTTVYEVPFEEFSILQVKGSDKLKPLSGCGIAIVVNGQNTKIGDGSSEQSAPRGSVWFVGAGSELSLEQGDEDEVWMAFYDGDKEVADQVGAQ